MKEACHSDLPPAPLSRPCPPGPRLATVDLEIREADDTQTAPGGGLSRARRVDRAWAWGGRGHRQGHCGCCPSVGERRTHGTKRGLESNLPPSGIHAQVTDGTISIFLPAPTHPGYG